jgi:hypothetical protein
MFPTRPFARLSACPRLAAARDRFAMAAAELPRRHSCFPSPRLLAPHEHHHQLRLLLHVVLILVVQIRAGSAATVEPPTFCFRCAWTGYHRLPWAEPKPCASVRRPVDAAPPLHRNRRPPSGQNRRALAPPLLQIATRDLVQQFEEREGLSTQPVTHEEREGPIYTTCDSCE